MQIDRGIIEAKLQELNGGNVVGDWVEAEGFLQFNAVDINQDPPQLRFDKGIIVKILANVRTGEVRMFTAKMLQTKQDA